MAEENMTPVSGTEPPPASPIANAQGSTLKLKPVIRKPTIGGAGARPTLKPAGLKLPTPQPAASPAAGPSEPAAAEGGAMEQIGRASCRERV